MGGRLVRADPADFRREGVGMAMTGSVSGQVGDFGGVVTGRSAGYVRPQAVDDVVAAVNAAAAEGRHMTLRGAGHSFGGQSAPDESVILDMTGLDDVGPVSADGSKVRCGPGATLRDVVDVTLPRRLLPPTLTNLLDLTVGGLVSVGGIGAASHRFGPVAANVESVDVVTSDGRLHKCGGTEGAGLFDAVLCGLGRNGVIVSVELRLRAVGSRVRTFYLLYDDHRRWIDDQRAVCGQVTGIEGFCSPNAQGLRGTGGRRSPFVAWFYPLQVSVEYDVEPPDLPGGVEPYRVLAVEDDQVEFVTTRHDTRFAAMRKLGLWHRPHPCVSALIELPALAEILPDVLDDIPVGLGDAYRGIFLVDATHAPTGFAPGLRDGPIAFFTIMHSGVAADLLDEVL